jgi:hypothetical protein
MKMIKSDRQLKSCMKKLDTVLKRSDELLDLGEEVEVSLADAGMVAEEMEPVLSHLDCFRRNLIENLSKPLPLRSVGSCQHPQF